MGLFSLFKKKEDENFEQILSSLEQEIRQAEKQKAQAAKRLEWWSRNWLFYIGIGWLAYAAGFVLYVWPERYGSHADGFVFHLVMVLVLLVVLYYGRVIIRSIGKRSVRKHEQTISRLKEQLKSKIEELKKKTAYDTTKSLIDKYSVRDKQDGRALSPADKARLMEAKRRQTMPNFAASPASQSGASGLKSPVVPANGMARQLGGPMQQGNAYPVRVDGPMSPQMSAGVVKLPGRSASLQPMDSPIKGKGARPWLDKLVDQLVGDVGGADDRYALICRFCYAHNGLVLEEEINDIQYNCPKCGKFNPSLRTLKLQNRVESQQIIRDAHMGGGGSRGVAGHYDDYEDFSDYGSSNGDDAYDHDSEEGSAEDKSIQADMSGEFGTPSPQRTARARSLSLIDDNAGDGKEPADMADLNDKIKSPGGTTAKTPMKGRQRADFEDERISGKDSQNNNVEDQGPPVAASSDALSTPKRGKGAARSLLDDGYEVDQSPASSLDQAVKSPASTGKTPAKATPGKSTPGKRRANKSSKPTE